MNKNKILGVTIATQSKSDTLEKIIKYISQPKGFYHVVSLNPEILVIAQKNKEFKNVVETAQIKIVDGMGIVLAGRFLNTDVGERLTGVDLMAKLIEQAGKLRLRVLLIGGEPNLANELVECYKSKYPEASFIGLMGIKNIKTPQKSEEKTIFDIVRSHKPHMIFVSFGSPDQELWTERHKKEFSNSLVMGVGGAFDFLSGKTSRAPEFVRKIGMEWFYRLVNQPWRWRRQLRLLEFTYLVIREKWKKI
ncbi:WecB/TagA/CpsF family glycosyltransferase [Patescibacteria group bacterium]|nr:WecB/TagA/CpsF family glycosyltransferase [Patescibacteria group bacterium]